MDEASESPLPPALLRSLGDRSYDKRKGAALEIEALIKALALGKETDRVCSVLALLGQDFATSTNSNHRKGGLIGLAATAIGLAKHVSDYLDALLPPVLHCLDDPESRVRYYACESLYNIAKVARGAALPYFNQIFDGVAKLFADVDIDVKNGANLLDRLIKDIVTESPTFEIAPFIPLLQKYIRRSNPYIRQLVVGWITVLDSVPDITMLDWLPDFLDGLFAMLSDSNREIRSAAEAAINGFLVDIANSKTVEFGPMVPILVDQCRAQDRARRCTAVTWVRQFIELGKSALLLFYSELLGSIMHCIADTDVEIRAVAGSADARLLSLVRETTDEFELSPLVQTLTQELQSTHVPTRLAALKWLTMLLAKAPVAMARFIGEVLPYLLVALSDDSDDVVLLDLEVLARIAVLDAAEFKSVLGAIVRLFRNDRRLLETRGSLIIRRLCALLDARAIFVSLAGIVSSDVLVSTDVSTSVEEAEFRSIMVQTLSLILLTARELDELRVVLVGAVDFDADEDARGVFVNLFNCWAHNPVATLALCLVSQAYDLSAHLVPEFAHVDVTVGFLMGVDKLVQLLESPVFLQLRLQLLDVDSPRHGALLKSLYGVLMLLPQSTAFAILANRLATVSSLKMHFGDSRAPKLPTATAPSDLHARLLSTFARVQLAHARAKAQGQTRALKLLPK